MKRANGCLAPKAEKIVVANMQQSAKSPGLGKQLPYISDRKLLGRVRQVIDTPDVSQSLDPLSVTLSLQRLYTEYGRKKTNSLKHSVIKALQIIMAEMESELNEVENTPKRRKKTNKGGEGAVDIAVISSDSEGSFDDGDISKEQPGQGLNEMLTNLYANKSKDTKTDSDTSKDLTPAKACNVGAGIARTRSEPTMDHTGTPPVGMLSCGSFIIDRSGLPSRLTHHSLPASPLPSSKAVSLSEPASPIVITVKDGDSEHKPRPKKTAKTGDNFTPTVRKTQQKLGDPEAIHLISASKRRNPLAEIEATFSTTTFADIGGNEKTIEDIKRLLIHMKYPEVYQQLGISSPNGFLLHGPPGCGKTLMAHAIAGELELPFLKLAGTELVSGVSGESEGKIRKLFVKAKACAPCILFIDEVDSITPKRETASKDMERRIVSQFLTCLDELNSTVDCRVLVIGATNRPDSIDPGLRRAGRFDREICLGIPDLAARERILQVLCRGVRLESPFEFRSLAMDTPGYVGADLSSLVREAAVVAVNRIFISLGAEPSQSEPLSQSKFPVPDATVPSPLLASTDTTLSSGIQAASLPSIDERTETSPSQDWWKSLPHIPEEILKSLAITTSDFRAALKVVQPSAKREGFATVPDVTWEDVGALETVREELQMAILAPVRFPSEFASLGLSGTAGVLLTGPPGCGKTLLAKAIANESGINFISVKGPELINMYVGESEKAVRQVFQRARSSSPCVVFFDEIDALCPKRSLSSSDHGSSSRIVNQLLTELDGLEDRKHVFVMAATNRPDIIDPAVLRPGRLDKALYIGVPTLEDRVAILNTITRRGTQPCTEGVDMSKLASQPQCDGYSGADLSALVREASMAAMRDYMKGEMTPGQQIKVKQTHFDQALTLVRPSISKQDRLRYEHMARKFSSKTSLDLVSSNSHEPVSTDRADPHRSGEPQIGAE